MVRNKPRLYLAVYEQPSHPKQHRLALMVCPKHHDSHGHARQINKFQIKATDSVGQDTKPTFEKTLVSGFKDPDLLVLLRLGKIKVSVERMEEILSEKLGDLGHDVDEIDDEQAESEAWVRAAIKVLKTTGALAAPVPNWNSARRQAYDFVQEELTAGRWSPDWQGDTGIPIRYLGSGLTLYLE